MPVVRTIRVRVDWVQFPAPRPREDELELPFSDTAAKAA